jgi:hypothetical protein
METDMADGQATRERDAAEDPTNSSDNTTIELKEEELKDVSGGITLTNAITTHT